MRVNEKGIIIRVHTVERNPNYVSMSRERQRRVQYKKEEEIRFQAYL
jgi:hypothetical protein